MSAKNQPFFFHDLFSELPPINIVDIGAHPLTELDPPIYQTLLKGGFARVIGFEPERTGLTELNRTKGPHETYLPYVIGDGQTHEFKGCWSAGMSSLLEPNRDLLSFFHGFPEWGTVQQRIPAPTVRLDDVSEIRAMDFLKIDVQGAELMVLEHAQRLLADCLVIQAEVEFLPMYKDQPLFSEIEMFLRRKGFVVHRFAPLASRVLRPMIVNRDVHASGSQIFWADAVFVRDFTRLAELSAEQLLKYAFIVHGVYGSFDLALRVLMEYDRRVPGAAHAQTYSDRLTGAKPA